MIGNLEWGSPCHPWPSLQSSQQGKRCTSSQRCCSHSRMWSWFLTSQCPGRHQQGPQCCHKSHSESARRYGPSSRRLAECSPRGSPPRCPVCSLSLDANLLSGCNGAREDTAEGAAAALVRSRDHLRNVHHQRTLRITATNGHGCGIIRYF